MRASLVGTRLEIFYSSIIVEPKQRFLNCIMFMFVYLLHLIAVIWKLEINNLSSVVEFLGLF